MGVRGKMVGYDLGSGKAVWQAYNTGPDKDVLIGSDFKPFYKKDQGKDLGAATWPPDQWKLKTIGDGSLTILELNQIYYGTGNTGAWNPDLRPGDNKWSLSVIARDPDTGQAKWAYQFTPHDEWDYDEIMENIAVDMNWHGQPRKLLIHPARNGFVFVLDRQSGELLSAEIFEKSTNWASGYDLHTGLPHKVPEKATRRGRSRKISVRRRPEARSSFLHRCRRAPDCFIFPAHNTCMNYQALQAKHIRELRTWARV